MAHRTVKKCLKRTFIAGLIGLGVTGLFYTQGYRMNAQDAVSESLTAGATLVTQYASGEDTVSIYATDEGYQVRVPVKSGLFWRVGDPADDVYQIEPTHPVEIVKHGNYAAADGRIAHVMVVHVNDPQIASIEVGVDGQLLKATNSESGFVVLRWDEPMDSSKLILTTYNRDHGAMDEWLASDLLASANE